MAFKPHDAYDWWYETISDPETRRYVHKESNFIPSVEDFQVREFQVKVKSFNVKGDGPYSLTTVIYYPKDGEGFIFGFLHFLGKIKGVTREQLTNFISFLIHLSDFFSTYRVSNRRLCQAGVLHRSSGLVVASCRHWYRPAAVH